MLSCYSERMSNSMPRLNTKSECSAKFALNCLQGRGGESSWEVRVHPTPHATYSIPP